MRTPLTRHPNLTPMGIHWRTQHWKVLSVLSFRKVPISVPFTWKSMIQTKVSWFLIYYSDSSNAEAPFLWRLKTTAFWGKLKICRGRMAWLSCANSKQQRMGQFGKKTSKLNHYLWKFCPHKTPKNCWASHLIHWTWSCKWMGKKENNLESWRSRTQIRNQFFWVSRSL